MGGGVETAFTALVSGLAGLHDVEPHVITFVPGLDEPERKDVAGVPVHYLPGTNRLGSTTLHLRERRSLARALVSLRPDLVHGQETARYGYVCLKNERFAPVVLNVHGIVRQEVKYATGIAGLRLRTAGILLERYCIRHGRYFVQSTPYPEHVFGAETRGRFVDIRNPIEERFFSLGHTPEPGRIVYSGALIPRKRLLDLIEALSRVAAAVHNAHLHVAGGEPDAAYSAVVRARVRELGLEGRVIFLGPLSPEEMRDEYRHANVFVLASGQETSPLAIGEAMAVGLPVVAANAGGVPFLVEEGVTGHVVEVGDVDGLARGIAEVLARPDRGIALGAAARKRAERDFRPPVVAARMRAFYEEVLSETQP